MNLYKKNLKKLTESEAYYPSLEHDACGVGLVASTEGKKSRKIVEFGIQALKSVWHRGAVDADGKTGDGAGIHIEIPTDFFKERIENYGRKHNKGIICVGMIFLPRNDYSTQEKCKTLIESELLSKSYYIYRWRQVPINTSVLGVKAENNRPEITQVIFKSNNKNLTKDDLERDLFVVRKKIEKQANKLRLRDFYICSLSSHSIIYKGMFLAEALSEFYPDLMDKRFISRFAIFHQRYSTNTFPSWDLAQPFRTLAHNGEINTLKGNINWMKIHEQDLSSKFFDDIESLKPVITPGNSDSAALDNVFELLVRSGKSIPLVKLMLIPDAWSKRRKTVLKAHQHLFNFLNSTIEPWDGPAAIAATDGKYRKNGEDHQYQGHLIHMLQHAVTTNSYETYKKYVQGIYDLPRINLRDLLAFKKLARKVNISEVEPVDSLRKRFGSGSMSHGALSAEAHETLAIAMNRIGAASCSGEGGEDPKRFIKMKNGDSANSKVKQIASARFGVTVEYLNNCNEIEIKIAQGAKPGEGGQLPGFKVSKEIAKLRLSTPGVTLISPPPHHDIYSIEDLAQLIYDLKQTNPNARVGVKLVASTGVGTIAAGVAKAKADVILISGHSGGTGASPQTSIKHVGIPWEMGLTEVNQILTLNSLRHQVTLRTDGGIKTGRDVVTAAMMGAEEFGIGTTSLVAMGCIMVRQCHSNTCPVGVCTQDLNLRRKFTGTPEKVVNLFTFIAQEVREILAWLGFKNLNEIIGRTDLLRQVSIGTSNLDDLDLNPLLVQADPGKNKRYCESNLINKVPPTLDEKIYEDIKNSITQKNKIKSSYKIKNTHRAVGTRLSHYIFKKFGNKGIEENTIEINLEGSAGQSLGAFGIRGLKLNVTGDANDYVGKGLSGATIVIKPPIESNLVSSENTIIGNTVLYGATSGKLFAAGQSGERFAVRNSGAEAVIEGCDSNGCEYMTGGSVVILGKIGDNFAAGMTGGMAFIYDPDQEFENYVNLAW